MTNSGTYQFSTAYLITFIAKWKKQLLSVTLIAAIISTIVSFLIEPRFKATAVIYPTKNNSVFRSMLLSDRVDILALGDEEEAEKLVQVLNANEIRDKIVSKYNLMERYDINSTDKYAKTYLIEEYDDRIAFKRTEYQSVRITVLDRDPDTAAKIAYDIVGLVDSVRNRMSNERGQVALDILEIELKKNENNLHLLEDSITSMRKKGLHEYEIQVSRLSKDYSKAVATGNTKAEKAIEDKLLQLADKSSAYITVRDQLGHQRKRVIDMHNRYEEMKMDLAMRLPQKFVVDYPFAADKKTYPIRWVIVVVSTLAAFFIAILGIIIMENYKKFTTSPERQ